MTKNDAKPYRLFLAAETPEFTEAAKRIILASIRTRINLGQTDVENNVENDVE